MSQGWQKVETEKILRNTNQDGEERLFGKQDTSDQKTPAVQQLL